eukprot:COSAG02_NODE_1155_length_14189_cov_8.424060_6_plen_837_part_00
MFGSRKKELLFDEVTYLKGPPQKVLRAKAEYKPSHAGTVAMAAGETVQMLGFAPGGSKDWSKVKLTSGVEGFVPSNFLSQSLGPPQLLKGRLQLARTDLKFEGDTGGMAGLVIKAPMEGMISCAIDQDAEDISRGTGPLKTLKVSYHEKGFQKGERRDIELLLPEEQAGKLERGMPELMKAAQEAVPQGDWKERMAAKKEEMRTAALNAAINTAGALMQAQEALESTGVGMALKNFGVADEFIEEVKRPFEAGERVESLGGDQGLVVEATYVEAREATMVKVKLDSGRVRTYFENDIRRVARSIFGPEPVKIKSLSKSAATDDISLQLESAKISIDAEVMKFSTDDGWTEATIFLRDITQAKLDMKATFQFRDPLLATTVTLVSLMFESKTANLQLLVSEDRGRAIIQGIDSAREAWMAANKERLQKQRQEAPQPTPGAPAASAAAPAMSLTPGDGATGSGDGWGGDSMAVPAGWPPAGGQSTAAAAPGAFGAPAGGWGDVVADALGGDASDGGPKPSPAVGGGAVDLLGLGGFAAPASGGTGAGGGMLGAGQLDAGTFTTNPSTPAPAIGGGVNLLGGATTGAGSGVDLLGGGAAGSVDLLKAPSTTGSVDLLGAPAAAIGGGGMLGGGQLDAGLFVTDEADAGAASSSTPAEQPAAAGGDKAAASGADGWGASATAIPEGWPTVAGSGADLAPAPAPANVSSNTGWGESALAIPDGWPTTVPTPVPAPAPAIGVDLLGGGAAGSVDLLKAPSTTGSVDLLGAPAAAIGGGGMLGGGQLDAGLFVTDEADAGAASSSTPAEQPAAAGGDKAAASGADGWGASATAIPEGWPTLPQ